MTGREMGNQPPHDSPHTTGSGVAAGSGHDPYRELFESCPDAILIIEDRRFVDFNPATLAMLGYSSKDDLIGRHPSEFSPPKQPDGRDSDEKAEEMMSIALAKGWHRFEWIHRRANGENFPVEVLLTAVQRGGRHILHTVWRDITERKQLEEQLLHAQKIQAIGKLAGGIAHDFNNILVAIIGNVDVVQASLADRPDLQAHLEEALKAGDRAASLVRQLLTYSRRQDSATTTVADVGDVVDGLEDMLRRLLGEKVELVTRRQRAPLRVRLRSGHLEQVITNLATNARDAMPGGGRLIIEARQAHLDAGAFGTVDQLPEGEYAVLSVTDTGTGMEPGVARRAIDPFFTTKPLGEGTGLGLSTVYGIAKQAGGSLSIHTTRGLGTTVKVFLPLTTERAETAAATPVALPARGGTETVLVVEDEAAVARLVTNVLRSKGYHVLTARNGSEGLAVCLGHHGAIDLIVSDVVMPRMNGPQMVAELRRAGSNVPVLFISGYTDSALAALDDSPEGVDLLEKPFSARELAGRVRLALDG